jgi:hypothetical protein
MRTILFWILAACAAVGCSDSESGEDAADAAVDAGSDAGLDVADTDGPEDATPDTADVEGEPDASTEPSCIFDCEGFESACGDECPELSDFLIVVPSVGLPEQAPTQNANNNLDVVWHEGRVFLAFRTAPYHFADEDATLHVVSSADQTEWTYEGTFHVGSDLREPRLLSWNGDLWLYFAVLGTNPVRFEPQGMMLTRRTAPGQWTEPAWFYGEGFIPWRTKVIDDVPYMVTYVGGESIYELENPDPIRVHWLTTQNGVDWVPVVPDTPEVLVGGSSETAFELLDDGGLIAVSRNEAGDPESGWGSKICRAQPEDLAVWSCAPDPRKYDSPLMFRQGDALYLVARRNVTDSGHYDLGGDELEPQERTRRNLLDYSSKPKRCALWEVDPDTQSVRFLLDLPSRGDTCFPGLVRRDERTVTVYNYTSAVDGLDVSWLGGQGGHTYIYRVDIHFPE